ncbi:uncharacterized protein N7459_006980 [Penicillium hispanicum]|uniref:uncharacterized protein n=1 Tax=Penicillium hispanicum TaxID=1080232 RepID=UPI002540D1A5|nr:uncharacterized protein N7459_006980 [Penicillium hispanicum]KAJ5578016.1 hypothetical protein N7459_006980 [Penicillium hispanicum]
MARQKIHVPPLDSPSKQLILDLARDLEKVQIFNTELKKVHAYERKVFYENLDRIDQEREAVHTAALDEAAAFHDRIREEAEATLREHLRAEEEERRRKEEEARKERERIEREKAEKLRREQEEAARLEAERKAREAAKKKAEEEVERTRRAAAEEKERKERQELERVEAEKKRQEEAAKNAKEQAEQQARAQQQQKIGGGRLTPEEIRVQERYVELHKVLKDMRKWLQGVGKQQLPVKQAMGDMRRAIKKCVGQLRDGKGTNKQQTQQIRVELEKALAIAEPSVDVSQFIAFPPQEIAQSENKAPALLIYGLNIFAKSLVSALVTEASINPGHAEPIGILAAQIFSMDAFMYKGIHMSDILWAKYRVVCPALWGFTGNEKTEAGRRALGWWREEAGGPFVSEQTHLDRMTALGAGYAAITLRNFGRTQRRNPFPNTMFWNSMQKILSIPPVELQDTQITLLQTMLKNSAERILGFFGQIGLVLLRRAVVDLPAALPRQSMCVNQLKLLREIYAKDKNIIL